MNSPQVKMVNQIYPLLKVLSRTNIPKLPKVDQLAKQLEISRQAIYRWMNGDMSSLKIAKVVNDITGSTFPAKLKGSDVNLAKHLFTISAGLIRYNMYNDIK